MSDLERDLPFEALLEEQREDTIRDVIESSRDDVPPPGGKERLLATLDLAPPEGGGGGAPLSLARHNGAAYVVGLALAIGAGAGFVATRSDDARVAPPHAEAAAASSEPAALAEPEPGEPARAPHDLAAPPEVVAPPEGASVTPARLQPSVAEAAPRPPQRPRASAVPGPKAIAAKGASAPNTPASGTRSESTLGREVARMTAARSALAAGDAARTLAILDSYDAEFPAGAFSVEVSVLRVEALARSGRMDEARRLGERFLQQHPHGLFARRVASTLGMVTDVQRAAP